MEFSQNKQNIVFSKVKNVQEKWDVLFLTIFS